MNEGTEAVQLRSEGEKGYMQLSPGGKAYIQTNSWSGARAGEGFAFIGEGGVGVKSLPDSTVWIDDVEVRIGERTEILNTSSEDISVKYAKAGVRQQKIVTLGPNGAGFVAAGKPFQVNGLRFGEPKKLDD